MAKTFDIYSKYYTLLYGDKNYTAEADYVIKQIKSFAPKAMSILEFGCGTGGHGLLLQEKGFKIFGLDQSENQVIEAQNKGLPCMTADIRDFKLKETYDVVISLFHVLCYLTTNDELLATFKNAHQHLSQDGIFLFDVWYSPAVYEQKPVTRVKKMGNNEISITRLAEPKIDVNKNIVDVEYTIFAKDIATGKTTEMFEGHPVRHFSIPEMELVAKLTGFEIVKTEEFLTGKMPGADTWGVCFIMKKYDH